MTFHADATHSDAELDDKLENEELLEEPEDAELADDELEMEHVVASLEPSTSVLVHLCPIHTQTLNG